jgi:hypothetical protein
LLRLTRFLRRTGIRFAGKRYVAKTLDLEQTADATGHATAGTTLGGTWITLG